MNSTDEHTSTEEPAQTAVHKTEPAQPQETVRGSGAETAGPQKSTAKTDMQYALMSAFVYPGVGQIARRQAAKGIIMMVFFTVFLIIWGYLAALGLISIYSGKFESLAYSADMELGLEYLKRSLIPGAVAAVIFIHSVYDAYRG